MVVGKPTHESFPLRTVSRLTGLTPDLIRAWEKRYAVVAPSRGPRGARLYTAADIEHLRLLRRVVVSGRAIGDVAKLTAPELAGLVAAPSAEQGKGAETSSAVAADVVAAMLAALRSFDEPTLDRILGQALMAFGAREFIAQIAKPLLDTVGQHWSDGRLSIADEHLISALLRNLLTSVMRSRGQHSAITVLLATPAGERHELGLLLAGLMIVDAGLRLCYLGTDLPAAELVSAARRAGATVVGLGLVYGENQETAIAEVRRIERELAPGTELWLGGRQAAAVARNIGTTRALVVDEIPAIDHELARVRAQTFARP